MSTLSSYEEYFKKYRDVKAEIDELKNEIKEARNNTIALLDKQNVLTSELRHMQYLITQMVDNGWEPVEAVLKIDHLSYDDPSLWQNTEVNEYIGSTKNTKASDENKKLKIFDILSFNYMKKFIK